MAGKGKVGVKNDNPGEKKVKVSKSGDNTGTIEIKASTSKDAANKKGYFSDRHYNGKTVTTKSGRVSAVKLHDGTVLHANSDQASREISKKAAYDKKLYEHREANRQKKRVNMANPIN